MSLVLAAEIVPMAILGIPSGAVVQRSGSRTTMLVADASRAPILASIPLLYSAGVLTFGLLLAIVALLGCIMPPYFASQRTILPELVGAFVPRRKVIAGAVQHGALAGLRFLLRDRLLAPLAALVVAFGFLGAGMSAGLPVYAFDEFDGSSWIAGLFYSALGAGAVVGSVLAVFAVKRVPPLRLLGVLTARTPGELRPKVMTAVITANTLAAPPGFRLRGAGARALGRRAALHGRRPRHDVDGDRVRSDHLAARRRDGPRARDDVERPPARDGARRRSPTSPYLMQTAYKFTFAGADESRFSNPIPHVASETGPFATAMITLLSATKPPLRTFCPVSQASWNA